MSGKHQLLQCMCMCMYVCMCVYVYMYVCEYVCVCVCMYVCVYRIIPSFCTPLFCIMFNGIIVCIETKNLFQILTPSNVSQLCS